MASTTSPPSFAIVAPTPWRRRAVEIEARLANKPVVMLDETTAERVIDRLDRIESRFAAMLATVGGLTSKRDYGADQMRQAWDEFINAEGQVHH